jgi:hypothetical protein
MTPGLGIGPDLRRLFAASLTNLYLAGAAVAAYAVLEAAEAAGLWLGRRWAEYLTFLATVVFVPYELYELTKSISALKVLALVINLAIAAYLLMAKRLFGLRGGGRAERAELAADIGWAPVERATPGSTPSPAPHASSFHDPRQPVSWLSTDVSPASAQPRRGAGDGSSKHAAGRCH